MKTARGIYLNLQESEYTVFYSGYTFYFSSKFNRKRFIEQYSDYHLKMYDKIRRTLNINPFKIKDLNRILLFTFYEKIEKRGFYITHKDKGGVTEWQSNPLKVINTNPGKAQPPNLND